MFTLEPFNQSKHLQEQLVSDRITRRGICAALCNLWIKFIHENHKEPPSDRLDRLRNSVHFAEAMNQQREFARDWYNFGRETAMAKAGQKIGKTYDTDKTVVEYRFVGMAGIRERISKDLQGLFDSARWELRFGDNSGHAIAGFCGVTSVGDVIHQQRMHIFDPNIGEYSGTRSDLDAILLDLLEKFPIYRTLAEVHRASL